MNIVDRATDEFPQVGAQDRGARRRISVFNAGDLLVKLIDDDVGVQRREVGNLRKGIAQPLLHADEIRNYEVDLIRRYASDLARRAIIEELSNRQCHFFFSCEFATTYRSLCIQ